MKQIQELAKSLSGMEQDILDALEQPKSLLSSLFSRLKLKEKPFSVFAAATEEIQSLWDDVRKIDGSLEPTDTTSVDKRKERAVRVHAESL